MTLPHWNNRAFENAVNFNPAFLGALSYEFVRAYESAKDGPPNFALIFCALPLALYPETRGLLPSTTRTKLLSWLERTPEALVGYSDRARSLSPYLKEALIFAIARDALTAAGAGIAVGEQSAAFTKGYLDSATSDVRETVRSIKMIGKWFAAAGEPGTIMVSLGVRP